jgi:hypothetical protein
MAAWPELRVSDWRDTYVTFQLYAQIVGKIRQALTPKTNEFWNVALHVTPRGLTTGAMPYVERTLSIDFDLLDHQVVIADSDGNVRKLPLARGVAVCDFHHALFAELAAVGVRVRISEKPQECPLTTPFKEDREHAGYDAGAVRPFWEAMRRTEVVFQRFRARFRGKCSPVHFFWGACDLAVTRFNGKRAPPRDNVLDREAYDEECISLGFWPGDPWTGKSEAFYYSYTIPAPQGLENQRVRPDAARFDAETWKEFILPYEDVRRSADPEGAILEFAESAYAAGATLAGWDTSGFAYRSS